MAQNTLQHWLIIRVRALCIGALLFGSVLPPYIPKAALAQQDISVASNQLLLVEDGFLMKSSSLTRQGARRAYADGTIHTVKQGDSLERLSRWYNVAVETIQWANDLDENDPINPGNELLVLPVDGVLHTVSRGQTLSRIAQLYDVEQEKISNQNSLKSEFILAGQQLIIPGGRPIVGKVLTVATVDEPSEEEVKEVKDVGEIKEPAPQVVVKEQKEYTPTPTAGVLQKPCSSECFYTQYFHGRHFAVDMQERGGGPIYAAEAGRIIRSDFGWNGGYGNVIEIDHGNGLVTLYSHNKEHYVEVGDNVARGETIAWMGNTGLVYGKTGIHVHFEVRQHGVKKNPLIYLE